MKILNCRVAHRFRQAKLSLNLLTVVCFTFFNTAPIASKKMIASKVVKRDSKLL